MTALKCVDYGVMPKTQIAKGLGISRWTLDRYLAEIEMENRTTEVIG